MSDIAPFHSGWNVSIPDTGAEYIAQAGQSIAANITSAGKDVTQNLKQASATDGLLKTFATMKDPVSKNPLIDPDTMASISKQSLPAKQQFIGMLSASAAQQMQQTNEAQGQMNLLQRFQQNQPALNTKLLMSMTPGQRPAMPSIYENAPQNVTPAPQQQQAAPAQQGLPTPNNAAIHGYFNSQESLQGNPVHVLRGPDGKIVSVVDQSGRPVQF
jgi:hypothetical protein